ncbi:hypothetical protein Pelo_7154 [Pelomyxa schiedti]|nr:hypothetical protein Pelo_7154 [Pelomyxa schiedti]
MDMRTVDDFHAIVVTCQYHQRQRGRCTLEGVRQNLAALRVPYSQEWITEVLNRQYSLCYNIFFTNLNAGWTADAIANSMIDGQISDPNGPFFCMETVHAVRSQYQMTTQISPHSISPLLFTPAASISFPSTYAPVDPLMTAITTQISQISITPNTTIVSPVLPPSKPSTIGPPRPTPPPTKRPSTPPSTPPPTPPTTPSVKPVVEASPSTSPAPSSGKLLLSEPSGEYFPIQPSPGEYFRTCPHHERGYCRFVNLGHQQCPEGGHSSISTQVMKATLTPLVENTGDPEMCCHTFSLLLSLLELQPFSTTLPACDAARGDENEPSTAKTALSITTFGSTSTTTPLKSPLLPPVSVSVAM